ncbi:hypothetical protein EB1_26760 [Empedobacter brevis NBRC 14943 = ATCC 43319]|uniref:Uncharacterized protein n=2 Tax=Empedobacter brevis TaxID=247 RepID=A0A511NJG8_9FLAO|nr:hypothetical protein [Empedobacter brevis]GEM52886.1 hypothetical protein EB1_26760 [Empedobacter brevis NBRC 14943 = ATCC 43319]
MENPFKTMLADEKLPDTIKQKVMDDVALIKLSLEVADLVSVKYPSTIGNFFGIGKKTTNDKPNKKEKED